METRKLQTIGGGASFAVSLPKQWVERQGLKAGDEISIEDGFDGALHIHNGMHGSAPPTDRVLSVDSSDPDAVLRSLIGLYVNAFNRLVLEYKGVDPRSIQLGVEEACDRLTGLQVVEGDEGRTVLQDLSDISCFNLDKGLRRAQVLVQQMIANAARVIEGGDESVVRQTERYEAELDRLVLLLLKQYSACLRQGKYTWSPTASPLAGLHGMFMAQFLERIGDYTMRITAYCRFLAQQPQEPVTQAVKESLATLGAIVADAVRAFNQRDPELANQVIRRVAEFAPSTGKDGMFDVFTSPRTEAQVNSCRRCIKFFNILECIERVALYGRSIAETAINWSMVETPGD